MMMDDSFFWFTQAPASSRPSKPKAAAVRIMVPTFPGSCMSSASSSRPRGMPDSRGMRTVKITSGALFIGEIQAR